MVRTLTVTPDAVFTCRLPEDMALLLANSLIARYWGGITQPRTSKPVRFYLAENRKPRRLISTFIATSRGNR